MIVSDMKFKINLLIDLRECPFISKKNQHSSFVSKRIVIGSGQKRPLKLFILLLLMEITAQN